MEFRINEGPITMLGMGVNAMGRLRFVLAGGAGMRGAPPCPDVSRIADIPDMEHMPRLFEKEKCL